MNRSARLVLSVLAAATCTVSFLEAGAAHAAPTPGASTASTAYTVKAGDSLVGIANSFGIKVWPLLRANDLTLTSVIYPGDVLTVPAASPGTTSGSNATSVATAASAPAGGAGTTAYVVQAGDALAGIAWAHGVTLGALVTANGLTVASVIHPGRTLQVPPATRPIPTRTASASAAPAGAAPTASSTPAAPASSSPSSSPSSSRVDIVIGHAKAQVGMPYRFFAAGPDAFDCSGLVVAAFREAGITLPHQSRALASVGVAVDWTTQPILAGDLVLTASAAAPSVISHVGIALSDSTWIQAVGPGRSVSIGHVPVDTKILAVRRVL